MKPSATPLLLSFLIGVTTSQAAGGERPELENAQARAAIERFESGVDLLREKHATRVGQLDTILGDEIERLKNGLCVSLKELRDQVSKQDFDSAVELNLALKFYEKMDTASALPEKAKRDRKRPAGKSKADAAEIELKKVKSKLLEPNTAFRHAMNSIANGFAINSRTEGRDGLLVLAGYRGRRNVLQTHPFYDRKTPASITRTVNLPKASNISLKCELSNIPRRDWRCVIKVNKKVFLDTLVSDEKTKDGWLSISLDLREFAGKSADVEMLNIPNGWRGEHGFWRNVVLLADGKLL